MPRSPPAKKQTSDSFSPGAIVPGHPGDGEAANDEQNDAEERQRQRADRDGQQQASDQRLHLEFLGPVQADNAGNECRGQSHPEAVHQPADEPKQQPEDKPCNAERDRQPVGSFENGGIHQRHEKSSPRRGDGVERSEKRGNLSRRGDESGVRSQESAVGCRLTNRLYAAGVTQHSPGSPRSGAPWEIGVVEHT